jgi:hypothetical protein
MDAYGIEPDYIAKLMDDELEFLKFSLKWLRFAMFDEGDFKVNMDERKRAKEKLLAERERQRKEQAAKTD